MLLITLRKLTPQEVIYGPEAGWIQDMRYPTMRVAVHLDSVWACACASWEAGVWDRPASRRTMNKDISLS